jgi:transposase
VEESLRPGASVAIVARRHEVNANSVFGWRRQYEKGLLGNAPVQLLPVSVVDEPAVAKPTDRARSTKKADTDSFVQLELSGGTRVRVHGQLARELLRQLVEGMLAR